MARAKRKLPAKPTGFISPHYRGHFCPVIRYPNTKPPPPTTIPPTKTSRPDQTAPTGARTQKNPLPLRTPPAAFISPHHRGHFCPVIRYPNTKPPPPTTIPPTKTSRPDQTAPTGARTQKNPLPLRTPPAAFISPHHRGHFCPVIRYPNTKPPPPTIHTPQKPHGSVKRHRPIPEHKKTRCRSEHRRPFPLSLKKPQRCLNAIVQRQPPPAGAQHHLTQPNPNISGRRFTAFFALRCL